MALTLAELQAQRDLIIGEMGHPINVQLQGMGLTRRTQAELDAALQRVDAEIANLQSPQNKQFKITTSRGL